jgi:CBS domain-containing protein
VIKGIARGLDPKEAVVSEAMTPCPVSVYEQTPIEEALRMMNSGAFRRLPVLDHDGKLAGLLSLDDILALLAEEFHELDGMLSKQGPRVLATP